MRGMQSIKRGRGFRGAVSYIFAGTDARLVTTSDLMSAQDPASIVGAFALARQVRPDVAKPVWHQSLRLQEGEKLDDATWKTLTDDYMQRMGWDRENHQWVVVIHDDPKGQHVHIVASRVGADGQLYHGKNDNLVSSRIMRELEPRYGLRATPPRPEPRPDRGVRRGEALAQGRLSAALGTPDAVPPRVALQRMVREAARSGSVRELIVQLERQGVAVRASVRADGTVVGLSYGYQDQHYSGGQLGRAYGWPALSRQLGYQAERDLPLLLQRSQRPATTTSTGGDHAHIHDHATASSRAAAPAAVRQSHAAPPGGPPRRAGSGVHSLRTLHAGGLDVLAADAAGRARGGQPDAVLLSDDPRHQLEQRRAEQLRQLRRPGHIGGVERMTALPHLAQLRRPGAAAAVAAAPAPARTRTLPPLAGSVFSAPLPPAPAPRGSLLGLQDPMEILAAAARQRRPASPQRQAERQASSAAEWGAQVARELLATVRRIAGVPAAVERVEQIDQARRLMPHEAKGDGAYRVAAARWHASQLAAGVEPTADDWEAWDREHGIDALRRGGHVAPTAIAGALDRLSPAAVMPAAPAGGGGGQVGSYGTDMVALRSRIDAGASAATRMQQDIEAQAQARARGPR